MTVIHYMSSSMENRYKAFVISVWGGEVVYPPVYIAVLTFWRPSWTPSWILEKLMRESWGFLVCYFQWYLESFLKKLAWAYFFPFQNIILFAYNTEHSFHEALTHYIHCFTARAVTTICGAAVRGGGGGLGRATNSDTDMVQVPQLTNKLKKIIGLS